MASCIISTLKLVYGLNDLAYTLEVLKVSPGLFSEGQKTAMRLNMDGISGYISELPSLHWVFTEWEAAIKQNSHTYQVKTIGNLEKYFLHLSKGYNFQPDPELFVAHKEKPIDPPIHVEIQKIELKSQFLQQEIQHVTSPNADYPVPASDFWVHNAKIKEKTYPFEYLFTLHCVASICGDMSPSQLRYTCGLLDRFISKNKLN